MATGPVPINNLRIASPCSVGWDQMAGDDRARFCSLCSLHVYNISDMTVDEVHSLVMNSEGRVCARLHRRADGTVMTRDCPVGLRALRRRLSRIAGAALAAVFSVCSVTFAQSPAGKDKSNTDEPQVRISKTVTTDNHNIFTGVITDEMDAVIPGAAITLIENHTNVKVAFLTNADGEFRFDSLLPGSYSIEVEATGFKTYKLKELEIGAYEIARAEIMLKADGESSTVGILGGIEPSSETSIGTMIIGVDMLRRLPHHKMTEVSKS